MPAPTLSWKVGFEIELLAPKGKSRKTLAEKIALQHAGARVVPAFHPQAEVTLVEDAPVFENLTLAYDVVSASGALIVRCADDLTLQADLVPTAAPKPGWYRIASDDPRFLRLIMNNADPASALKTILAPTAKLFGSELEHFDNGMVRLSDREGAPIAMAAPLPGERERPCELITAPLDKDHYNKLAALLEAASDAGFTLPHEAANHIHFDASDLCSAPVIANLAKVFGAHSSALKQLVGTSTNCRRLGDWPDALFELVAQPAFAELPWDQARDLMGDVGLTKYCDFNLFNITYEKPGKHTFEVRILPAGMDAGEIISAAALFEALLRLCISNQTDLPQTLPDLIKAAPLTDPLKAKWLKALP